MSDLAAVFNDLRRILERYAQNLDTKKDTATDFYLDTRHVEKNKAPLFFGAVQIRKSFVSYHLMPVYVQPELLATVSPALKKRMQGKSCFNFSVSDPALLEELATLTEAGYASYRSRGFV